MAKAYDQAFKEKVIKERLTGLSIKSISIEHGISFSVIYKWPKRRRKIRQTKPRTSTLLYLFKHK